MAALRLWLGCALLVLTCDAVAQCPAQPWQTMGGVPGVYGTVRALVEWDPDGPGPLPPLLVAGGDIQAAGSRLVNNIATWDGAVWSTLGAGLPRQASGQVGEVTSLLVHEGQLFASGYSLSDGNGGSLGPVVRWTGTTWETVGQFNANGNGGMVEFDDGIAAIGAVDSGGSSVPAVVWWDGANSHTLGTIANAPGQPLSVVTLAVENGGLLAAGPIASINGTPCNGLARWDGASWEDLGLPGGTRGLTVASNGTVTVVCAQLSPWQFPDFRIFKRENGQWTMLPTPFPTSNDICGNLYNFDGAIYATSASPGVGVFGGGFAGVVRLEGSGWQPLGTSTADGVYALTRFRGGLVAGGVIGEADGRAASGTTAWDGAPWQPLGQGLSSIDSTLSVKVSGTHIYASGFHTDNGAGAAIVAWNGQNWDHVLSSDTLRVEVFQGDLILSSAHPSAGLLRFNGSTLEPIGPASQGSSVPFVVDSTLYSITDPWTEPSTVFRLDNTGWTQLGQSFIDPITSLQSVDGQLYMLGVHDVEAGINMVGRWNGAAWEGVGVWPISSVWPTLVNTVFRYHGQLIASGYFFPFENAFAVLTGDQWQIWPSPYRSAIARVINDDIVAVAGTSDYEHSFVVAFDGAAWRTLGTVATHSSNGDGVSDLQPCGDGVLVAGRFVAINGQCSHMFARLPTLRCCGSADFNNDGDPGTDADIQAFFACLAGDCCAACGSADFDDDGDTATDADIEAFFRVLAGGSC